MELRRFDELEPVPWRNGGGITREVMRVGSDDDFLVRVSIADVAASGPFSLFDGIDRVILLLDGPGMRLQLPDGPVDLRRGEPFGFDGAMQVRGEIMSATRDLNVMTRRGRATAELRVQAPGENCQVDAWCVVVIALDDGATAALDDGAMAAQGGGAMAAQGGGAGSVGAPEVLRRWDGAVLKGSVVVFGPAAIIVIDRP